MLRIKNLSRFTFVFVLLSLMAPLSYASGPAHSNVLANSSSLLVIQLGFMILAAWCGGTVFSKMRLPRVLGEVTSGIIIGPYLLGSIDLPFLRGGLFPIQEVFPVSPEVYALAVIASIILLFTIGLETDVELLFKFSAAGAIVGISGVITSFIAGVASGAFFIMYFQGEPFSFTHPVPLLLGVISTVTSISITARILSKRKKMDSPEGVTTLSAAVVDDVLGIIAFAVVIGVVRSGNLVWREAGLISMRALGIWLIFTAAGLIFSRNIAQFLKKFRDRPTMTVMSLSMALLLAGIFERSGLAMIIGAYVMGISISKTDISFVLRDNLAVLGKFFIPIFFCVMGMLIDLGSLARPEILFFGLIYTFLAIAGKAIGCGIPPLFMNFNIRGASRIGVGMVPRGEVALIISGLGLALGLIDRNVFSVAVIMTFLTTLLTPLVLDLMLRQEKPTLRKGYQVKKPVETIRYSLPNPETTDLILRKILGSFESEGFFIHKVSIPELLFNLRKNDVSISLHRHPQELVFECSRDDNSFVQTVFYEVVAELEDIMRRLESFSNKEKIAQDIFNHKSPGSKERIKISQIIKPETVTMGLKGISKKDIINEMVDLLISTGNLMPKKRNDVLKDLAVREKTMSTGMQDGIALPHAKTAAVEHLISAIGVKQTGVDFDSLDKKPAKIFVLTLAPRDSHEPYLQYVGEITKVLIDPATRERILSSKSDKQLYSIVTKRS